MHHISKKPEILKEELLNKHPDLEIINSEIKLISNKYQFKCKKCNYIFINSLTNVMKTPVPCKNCRDNANKINKVNKLKEKLKPDFELVNLLNFNKREDKIEVKHLLCNHILKGTAREIIETRHCKFCSSSKGESKILSYLEKMKIKYIHHYKNENCKNIFLLEFDFAIIDDNNDILFLIEFDGEQHFRPFRYGNKELMNKKFNDTLKRDTIKNNFCKENNLDLLRISYLDYKNIEDILNKYLEKYNLL